MDPTTATAITAVSTTSSGGVLAVVLLVILALIPVVVKFLNWSRETSAQGLLYQQLSEMVRQQRKEIDGLYSERSKLKDEMFDLKHKVSSLEGYEKVVDVLKLKLDEKDKIISERNQRVEELLEELVQLKERIHTLEMRLKEDEIRYMNKPQGE